jgi:hypothetical protein
MPCGVIPEFFGYRITASREFRNLITIFSIMKKMLFLIPVLILLASCNKEVCPAYSDAANNVKSSVFQSKAYRADGINRVYRDAYSYRKK